MSGAPSSTSSSSVNNPTSAPPTTAPTVTSSWLGADSLSTARLITDIGNVGNAIKKEDRHTLPSKDFMKLKETCERGVTDKFSMMKLSDQSEQSLKGIYDIGNRLLDLKKAFKDHDMDDVFAVASSFNTDPTTNLLVPAPTAVKKNLFDDYTQVDLETVKNMCAFTMAYGADYMVENLKWGTEKILNSCDSDLKSKINENLIQFEPNQQGSIVAFKLMMNLVTSTSTAALRGITNRMEKLRVHHFDGENVSAAVSFFRAGRTILKNNKAEPKDMATLIFNCFNCSSTKKFNTLVDSMDSNQVLNVTMSPEGVGNISATSSDAIDSFLQTLEVKYVEHLSNNTWEAKSTSKSQDSSFNATGTDSRRSRENLTCFNCGKKGHGYPNCPEPINQARIDANKEKFLASKRQSNDSSNQSSNSGSNPQGSNLSSGPNQDLSKIPPKPGMPNYRVLNKGRGPLVWWCEICGKWNEDHETSKHPTNAANNVSEGDDASTAASSHPDTSQHIDSSDFGGFAQGSLTTPHF